MNDQPIPTPETDAVRDKIKREGVVGTESAYEFAMWHAEQMEKNCYVLIEQNKKLHEDKQALIEQIINLTDGACDAMEGADWEDFIRSEARMCLGMDILKLFGVKYDPITGKREPLT